MVTIPWCSKMIGNIIAHVALTTSDNMELFQLMCLMFLHLQWKKKKKAVLFCAVFVHLKGSAGVTDSRLQRERERASPLFCILQLLYTVCTWCSFNLSALPRSGSTTWICTKQKVKLSHMGNDVFCHSKKKKKKNHKINVCETIFFFFFFEFHPDQ